MADVKIGSNTLIDRQLYYVDGVTELLIADLSLVYAEVKQWNRVLATYNLKPGTADPEIRGVGTPESRLEIEITKALSATFHEGAVWIKIYLEKADPSFIVDQEFAPILEFEAFTAVL